MTLLRLHYFVDTILNIKMKGVVDTLPPLPPGNNFPSLTSSLFMCVKFSKV